MSIFLKIFQSSINLRNCSTRPKNENRVIRKTISNNNRYQAILGSMVRLAAQFPSPLQALSDHWYTYLQ